MFCTFLSAPIIYISARMALVRNVSPSDYENIVTDTRTDSSIVSIVSVVSLMMCGQYPVYGNQTHKYFNIENLIVHTV